MNYQDMDSIEKKIYLEDENTYKSNKQYFDKYGNIKYDVSDNSNMMFSYDKYQTLSGYYDIYSNCTYSFENNPFNGLPSYTVNKLGNIFKKSKLSNELTKYYYDNKQRTMYVSGNLSDKTEDITNVM